MASNYVNAKYTEIIDLHTESDTVSVIGIHTPTNDTPRRMFKGFFEQFKKYRYKGCSIMLVPAARLPADPLQVSYDAGEPTIDPRDLMNPILWHGCHGDDMGVILNRLYNLNNYAESSDSVGLVELPTDPTLPDTDVGFQLEQLYYKALTDLSWKKANVQRGFKKSGLRPLVYQLASNHPIVPGSALDALSQNYPGNPDYDWANQSVTLPSAGQLQLMTPRLTRLGWMDCRSVVAPPVSGSVTYDNFEEIVEGLTASQVVDVNLPLVFMGVILLPPAYKTEQYFRMLVTHYFDFKDFRGISFAPGSFAPVYGDDAGFSPQPEPDPPVERLVQQVTFLVHRDDFDPNPWGTGFYDEGLPVTAFLVYDDDSSEYVDMSTNLGVGFATSTTDPQTYTPGVLVQISGVNSYLYSFTSYARRSSILGQQQWVSGSLDSEQTRDLISSLVGHPLVENFSTLVFGWSA